MLTELAIEDLGARIFYVELTARRRSLAPVGRPRKQGNGSITQSKEKFYDNSYDTS